MKKTKLYFKKSLSIFMAAMMLMTAWVFVAPSEAEAASAKDISSTNLSAVSKYSDSNFNTSFTTTSGNFQGDNASTMASRGYYKNVLYSPHYQASNSYLTDTYAGVYFGTLGGTADGARVWYPDTTLIYDGVTTPQIPILFDIDSNSNNRVGVKNVYISSGGNGIVFRDSYWTAKSECAKDTNYYTHFTFDWIMQNQPGNYWISTSSGNDKESMCSSKGYWDIYGTYLQYTGGGFGSGSTYYKAITPTWVCRTGSNYTGTTNKTIYVIDYVPLKNALNNVKSLINDIKTYPAKYTTASVSALVSAADKLIAAKPNDYINSSNNDVYGWNSAVSAALSAYNSAKNLAVQQYTLTFKSANGATKTYTYNYGTSINCYNLAPANIVTQISGNDKEHQNYAWESTNMGMTALTDDVTINEVASGKVAHSFPANATVGDTAHSWKCSVCEYVKTQDHVKNAGTTAGADTCTSDATVTYDCSVCGKAAISVETVNDIKGHDFSGDWVSKEDGKDGTHYQKCLYCDAHGIGSTVDACEKHVWKLYDTFNSTCKEAGSKLYKCEKCAASYTEVLELAAHSPVKTDKKDVTNICGGDGNVAFWTCSACNRVWKDEALTEEVTDLTDADGDNIPDVLETKGPDHEFTGACESVTPGADGTHKRQCKRFTQCKTYGPEENHNYGEPVVTESTCTAAGKEVYTCTDCKQTYEVALGKAEHNMKTIAAVAAECNKPGNNKYYYCESCKQYFKDEAGTTTTTVDAETIPGLTHEWSAHHDYDTIKDHATCMAAAVYYNHCDYCKAKLTDTHTYGAPAAHVYNGTIKDNGDGTHSYACTSGYNCGTYGVGSTKGATENCVYAAFEKNNEQTHKLLCACGAYITEDHSWGNWIADSTGVGTAAGTMTKTCADCKEKITTDCSYTEIGRADATCDSDGSITYRCTDANCGHMYTETIPAKGHKWVTGNDTYEKSPATCEANAVYYEYCTNCKNSSEAYTGKTWTKTNSKLTHQWGEWQQTVDADGVATHTRECAHASTANCVQTGKCSGGTANCEDKAICTTCKNAYGSTNGANHKTVITVTKVDSTCQKEGTQAYKYCDACKTAVDEIVPIEKKEHDWGSWSKLDGEDKHIRSCKSCDAAVAKIATEEGDCYGGIAYCDERATCEVCKTAYGDFAESNHHTEAWHYADNKAEATCQAEGYTGDKLYDCCNALMEAGSAIAQKPHDYSIEVSRTPATCTKEGSVVYKCSTCVEADGVEAAKKTEALAIDAGNHASEEEIVIGAIEANCTTDGFTGNVYHACCYSYEEGADNRKALIKKGEKIKANGRHEFISTAAEYMLDLENGEAVVVDGALKVIDTQPGYATKVDARHEDGKWYHAQLCKLCDQIIYEACYTYEHTYSCVATDICEVCNGLCSLTDADKHDGGLIEVGGVAATCQTTGKKAYYKCDDCNKTYLDAAGKNDFDLEKEEHKLTIPTTGHSFDWENPTSVTEATCGQAGEKTFTCTVEGCNETTTRSTGSATGKHTWETVVTQEATCGNIGYKADICSVCEAVKTNSYVTIPATGKHNFDTDGNGITERNDAVITAGTSCMDPGTLTFTCLVCGFENVETDTEDESSHKWSDWTKVGGDCSTGVIMQRHCKVEGCGEKEQKKIESDNQTHAYVLKAYVEPTEENDGYKLYECENCGEQKREPVPFEPSEGGEGETPDTPDTPDTPENPEDGEDKHLIKEDVYETVKEATCSSPEIRRYTCIRCGETVVKEYGEPLEHVWIEQSEEIATCQKPGHSAYYKCVRINCNAEYGEGKVIYEQKKHADGDGDGKCDGCNSLFYDENEGSKTCGCICHKENFISRIIYKILSIFWKLFKIGKSCECGAVHY